MRNSNDTYRRFIQSEQQAGAIYLAMAARFNHENPELGALWLELSMHEKQHADLLQFCQLEELLMAQGPAEIQIRNLNDTIAGSVLSGLARVSTNPRLDPGLRR